MVLVVLLSFFGKSLFFSGDFSRGLLSGSIFFFAKPPAADSAQTSFE